MLSFISIHFFEFFLSIILHFFTELNLLINSKADAVITIRKPDYPPQWMLKLGNEKKLKNLRN